MQYLANDIGKVLVVDVRQSYEITVRNNRVPSSSVVLQGYYRDHRLDWDNIDLQVVAGCSTILWLVKLTRCGEGGSIENKLVESWFFFFFFFFFSN